MEDKQLYRYKCINVLMHTYKRNFSGEMLPREEHYVLLETVHKVTWDNGGREVGPPQLSLKLSDLLTRRESKSADVTADVIPRRDLIPQLVIGIGVREKYSLKISSKGSDMYKEFYFLPFSAVYVLHVSVSPCQSRCTAANTKKRQLLSQWKWHTRRSFLCENIRLARLKTDWKLIFEYVFPLLSASFHLFSNYLLYLCNSSS